MEDPMTSTPRSEVRVCADDFEPAARALLPKATYDYIAGGAEDEATVAGNRAAYAGWRFRYHVLSPAPEPDMSGELFGGPFSMPIHLSPTAAAKMAHSDGELAVAQAAASAGVVYCLSTVATMPIEEVATAGGTRWFQLYVLRDRGLTTELIGRAASAGYRAIVLTVDLPVVGRRERDFRNEFSLPGGLEYPHLASRPSPSGVGAATMSEFLDARFDDSLTWRDLEWVVAQTTPLPVLVKGVVRAEDARRCVESGAQGVIVSNHGGRQLDYAIATLDALPAVVQEIGGDVPVLVDGGVRRGTDALKALALGARSVLIGRPYLWALAAGGRDGVGRLLDLLREEIRVSMTLLGVSRIGDLRSDLLTRAPEGAAR
jgi:isopentenyl diphosphate isomerase/L-lactate dehydrogenase-like FMN-dependent dehydrogenase